MSKKQKAAELGTWSSDDSNDTDGGLAVVAERGEVWKAGSKSPAKPTRITSADYGDVAAVCSKGLEKDRQHWKALVLEVVEDAKDIPPSEVLQHVGSAFGLSHSKAAEAFQQDCDNLRRLNSKRDQLQISQGRLDEMHDEHGREADLKEQVETMQASIRDVTKILKQMTARVVAIRGHEIDIQRAERNLAQRVPNV